MDGSSMLGTGMAMVAFSAPVTAAIVKLVPRRNGNGAVSEKLCTERRDTTEKALLRIDRNLERIWQRLNGQLGT